MTELHETSLPDIDENPNSPLEVSAFSAQNVFQLKKNEENVYGNGLEFGTITRNGSDNVYGNPGLELGTGFRNGLESTHLPDINGMTTFNIGNGFELVAPRNRHPSGPSYNDGFENGNRGGSDSGTPQLKLTTPPGQTKLRNALKTAGKHHQQQHIHQKQPQLSSHQISQLIKNIQNKKKSTTPPTSPPIFQNGGVNPHHLGVMHSGGQQIIINPSCVTPRVGGGSSSPGVITPGRITPSRTSGRCTPIAKRKYPSDILL